ncbi:MAG: DUF1080 domain-containing protein [Armatimonadia bacterium]|nr:DUF1080 domain-containing protein [Armatimonadia bacterium]
MPGTAVTQTLIETAEDADAELRLTLIEVLSGRDDPAAQRAADELGFVPLFDGETFQGWEGDTEDSFRIEDGAIVGGSLEEPIPHNEFLCTTEEYGDFILRLQVKAVDANGGIQFRSHRVEGSSEVSGYQADFDAHGIYWGCLYDESRRGMLVAVDQAMMKDIVDLDGWNDYEIRCEGPRIRLYVNGHQTVDYTEEDPQIPREGIIGLQVHSGPPSETWYRDIEIMELP